MSSLALSTNVCPNSWKFVEQQAEKYLSQKKNKSASIILSVADIALNIFGFLSLEYLGRVSCVCKDWMQQLESNDIFWKDLDLKKLFPKLAVLDEKVWKTYVDVTTLELDITGAPSQDKRMVKTVKILSSLQIDGESGITLLTIPKGFTFDKLMKVGQSPKQGNAISFGYIWPRFLQELRDIPVDKTYRVVITNNVLQGTRNLSAHNQRECLEILGCEMPGILQVATLAILTYISSPQHNPPIRLYNDNPWTYTRCSDQIGDNHLVSGGFALGGPIVSVSSLDSDNEGTGALLKC